MSDLRAASDAAGDAGAPPTLSVERAKSSAGETPELVRRVPALSLSEDSFKQRMQYKF